MLPEKDEEAANLLGVSMAFVILVSLLTVPLIWWGKDLVIRWLNAPGLASYLWLVPVMVFIHGVFLALNYLNSRTRHFGRLSIARVTSSLTTTAGKLGVGFMGYATAGTMIGATVAGQAVATSVLGGQIWRDDRRLFLGSVNVQGMLGGIRRYRKFPISAAGRAYSIRYRGNCRCSCSVCFSRQQLWGFYALGFRILQMPMSLVGSAIGQVFHQRAREVYLQRSLAPLLESVMKRLLMVILFPMLMLTVIGRDLYIVVFGQAWAEAEFTQILSVWAIVWFVSSPLSTLYGVMGNRPKVWPCRWQCSYHDSYRLASEHITECNVVDPIFRFRFFVYGYMILQISKFAGLDLFRTISGLTKCGALSLSLILMILALKMVTDVPAAGIAAGVTCLAIYFYMLQGNMWPRYREKRRVINKRFLDMGLCCS